MKDGHLIDIVDLEEIHNRPFHEYVVSFSDKEGYEKVDTSQVEVLDKYPDYNAYLVRVPNEKTDGMFRELHKFNIKLIREVQYTLEKYFMEKVIGGNEDGSENTKSN